jgi:hypothetical protein
MDTERKNEKMTIYEKAVQGQLDSYNAHNLEEFLNWYSEDIMGIDLDTDKILFSGKSEMRPRYKARFENKYLNCELVNRMVLNRTIIDHERITWDDSNETYDAIAIYDIGEDGLINAVRFTKGKL